MEPELGPHSSSISRHQQVGGEESGAATAAAAVETAAGGGGAAAASVGGAVVPNTTHTTNSNSKNQPTSAAPPKPMSSMKQQQLLPQSSTSAANNSKIKIVHTTVLTGTCMMYDTCARICIIIYECAFATNSLVYCCWCACPVRGLELGYRSVCFVRQDGRSSSQQQFI